MNIAYILNSTMPYGGATKSFMVMLKGLMEKGINPVVILPDRHGIYQELKSLQIPLFVTTFRMNSLPDVESMKDFLLFLPRLAARICANMIAAKKVISFLREKDIHIIHSNVSVVDIGYRVAKALKLPHIFHVREYVDKDFNIHYIPTINCLRKRFIRPASYTICITKDIQKYHHLEGVSTSRVIYNGIRPANMNPPSFQKENYLLYAGRVEPAKGITELLEGYLTYTQRIKQPLPLYIAGAINKVAFHASLAKFVEQHSLSKLVTFLGERKDIDQLMQKATAIVIPSRFEAFGRCMAEAMFNGCLVIARNTGGSKEQMDNGLQQENEEIALRYSTAEDLVQHLISVTMHAEEYLPYINRALRTVNALYTSETNAAQIYQFYQDIANGENH